MRDGSHQKRSEHGDRLIPREDREGPAFRAARLPAVSADRSSPASSWIERDAVSSAAATSSSSCGIQASVAVDDDGARPPRDARRRAAPRARPGPRRPAASSAGGHELVELGDQESVGCEPRSVLTCEMHTTRSGPGSGGRPGSGQEAGEACPVPPAVHATSRARPVPSPDAVTSVKSEGRTCFSSSGTTGNETVASALARGEYGATSWRSPFGDGSSITRPSRYLAERIRDEVGAALDREVRDRQSRRRGGL